MQRRFYHSLWLIVLAGLVLRVAVGIWLIDDLMKPRADHWPFGYETGRVARAIATGQGFANPLYHHTGPTAWLAPIYPYLLAGVFRLFGVYTEHSAVAIIFLNSLFSALACLPIFFAARKTFGEKVARWSAWIWAVFPYAVYFSANFVWDTALSGLLLATLFWIALELEEPQPAPVWAATGLLWGILLLINPSVASLLPFFLAWSALQLRRASEKWIGVAGVAAMLCAFSLLPWTVRNYVTFHRVIPIRDNIGLEFWVGNNGNTFHWFTDPAHPSSSRAELSQYDRLGELQYMAVKAAQARAYITGHPADFLKASLRRFLFTWTGYWSLDPRYLAEEPYDPPDIFFSSSLTLLMLIGLIHALRRFRKPGLLYLLILIVYPSVYYITHPDIRYRDVIDPQIVILAVLGAVALWQAIRMRRPVPA